MKISNWLVVLLAIFSALTQVQAGELLSRISEESEPVIPAADTAADAQGKLIYRVICSADDAEPTPDCAKPPLEDAFNQIQQDLVPQMPEELQTQAMQIASVSKSELPLLTQEQAPVPSVVKHSQHKKKHKAKKVKKK